MPFNSILMPYKQNCKVEGEIITRLKIAKLYYAQNFTQRRIAQTIKCHYNTVNNIIRKCKQYASEKVMDYLKGNRPIPSEDLELFNFLMSETRRPNSNKRMLSGAERDLIIGKHKKLNYGYRRMHTHLRRQKYDTENIYTLFKIRGVYQRNGLKTKKKRTANGNRRPLYQYAEIGAFEYLQFDVKVIPDQKALPKAIYEKFKNWECLPKYQWTIIDAKTRTRFLAWSYSLSSFFGYRFLELVICWLRAHGVRGRIRIQVDCGSEFCSGSKRKLKDWNERLKMYNACVYDTGGVKWKQNLVERSHRTDDEEFYSPRGVFIEDKDSFINEAQRWIIEQNRRPSQGIGMNGMSSLEKLQELGVGSSVQLCNFPCLILEDIFEPLMTLVDSKKSQNVLTYYLYRKISTICSHPIVNGYFSSTFRAKIIRPASV